MPARDSRICTDPGLSNLMNYAVNKESQMFDQANDQEEYFQLMSEFFFKLEKDLNGKHNGFGNTAVIGPQGSNDH